MGYSEVGWRSGWKEEARGLGRVAEEMEGDDNATNNRKVVLGNNSSCGTNTSYPFLDSLFHASSLHPYHWLLPTDNTSFRGLSDQTLSEIHILIMLLLVTLLELRLWKSTLLLALALRFHQIFLLVYNSKMHATLSLMFQISLNFFS